VVLLPTLAAAQVTEYGVATGRYTGMICGGSGRDVTAILSLSRDLVKRPNISITTARVYDLVPNTGLLPYGYATRSAVSQ
jgi:hypothetical protein